MSSRISSTDSSFRLVADQIGKFREMVRDVLKDTNQEVPCLGLVAFDNSGQNKYQNFDFLISDRGKNEILPIDEFLLMVKERVSN